MPLSRSASPFPRPANARELAFDVLTQTSSPAAFAAQRLDEAFAATDLAANDRRLAAEIVYGVVRRRATLDALIRPHVKRPLDEVEEGLLTLLQIGAYQLVLLSNVPPHAAVNETIEVARRARQPRWTGFVNAVLRSLGRTLTNEFTTSLAPRAVPLTDGRYRLVQQPVFPDPAADPGGCFAAAFSFPPWLTERWRARFPFDEMQRLGFWFNSPANISLRVNTLRGSREEFLRMLHEANVASRAGSPPEAVCLEETQRITDLPGFAEGWFVVQDESAMQAAVLLAPQPGEHVLDLCAAPGGKTAHLAGLMRNRGTIVAADVDAGRLAQIDETCRRLAVSIVETALIQRDGDDLPAGPFDAVLVDVPCSNTGVLGKRAEARWRLHPRDIAELTVLQTRLLRSALARVTPRGRVVYSTCSIEPEENRGVIETVLRDTPDVRLVEERFHSPGQPADGGYQALLRKYGV